MAMPAAEIERLIKAKFPDARIELKDLAGDNDHWAAHVVSSAFKGKNRVQQIYANAHTNIDEPKNLKKTVNDIDKLDWYSAREEGLGNLYEGLLEKNANEKKSGAGQYFTPRPLINSMVRVMKPTLDDIIQDPVAGTGGFLIAANHYLRTH